MIHRKEVDNIEDAAYKVDLFTKIRTKGKKKRIMLFNVFEMLLHL